MFIVVVAVVILVFAVVVDILVAQYNNYSTQRLSGYYHESIEKVISVRFNICDRLLITAKTS